MNLIFMTAKVEIQKRGGGGRRLDKISNFRGGCWERGGWIFTGGKFAVFT